MGYIRIRYQYRVIELEGVPGRNEAFGIQIHTRKGFIISFIFVNNPPDNVVSVGKFS